MLRNLMKAQCGNNLMHETVNVNNPSRCTRNWFEWANAMLVVFVENSLGESCDAYAQSEFEKVVRDLIFCSCHACFMGSGGGGW